MASSCLHQHKLSWADKHYISSRQKGTSWELNRVSHTTVQSKASTLMDYTATLQHQLMKSTLKHKWKQPVYKWHNSQTSLQELGSRAVMEQCAQESAIWRLLQPHLEEKTVSPRLYIHIFNIVEIMSVPVKIEENSQLYQTSLHCSTHAIFNEPSVHSKTHMLLLIELSISQTQLHV